MSTREVRPSLLDTSCDVCGRTLLRGERAEVYLDGPERRSVCELCKARALHEGWVREGTVPAFGGAGYGADRRRSLLGRLRRRSEARSGPAAKPTLADELDGRAWQDADPAQDAPPPLAFRRRSEIREPRHVRAVPSSAEQRIAEAIAVFNGSEHPRTIAGVARSLGIPTVAVRPSEDRASLVEIVVSWELCWYRYEIDLSDDDPAVRSAGQGYELSELEPEQRQPNASADDHGALAPA